MGKVCKNFWLEIGRPQSTWKMAAIVYLPSADLVAPLERYYRVYHDVKAFFYF